MGLDALARAANFRDLGGHCSTDGRRVRTGALFRSGELSRLTKRERAAFETLGLRTVLDLRTDEEVKKGGPTPCPRDGRVVRLAIDSGDLTSRLVPTILRGDFGAVPADFLQQVNRQLVRDAHVQFRAAIDLIADPSARPLLFHCTHGKDRAGLLAAFVLLALDVPWDAVLADYLRSNELRTAENRRQFRRLRLLAPLLSRRPWRRPDLGGVERLFHVAPENLAAARDEMQSRYGTVDAFLAHALGLDAARRAGLREQLLADRRSVVLP